MKRPWIFVLVLVFLAACAPAPTAAPASGAVKLPNSISAATAAPAATKAPAATAAGTMLTAYPAIPGNPAQLAFAPAGTGMVVKNAQMDLLVADTDRFIDQTMQMLTSDGGYLISSQTWLTDDFKYATLELGIPSDRFEAALTRVRSLSLQVIRENATGQDVTSAYVDLKSRLTNLEATSARVRDFLKDAQTTEDSLRINQQLSDLEVQIEQVKGQMHFYEGRSAYSTLTLSLTPQYPTPVPTLTPTPTQPAAWDPGKTFDQASGMLVNSAQTIADGLIWLVVGLGPFILVLILIILIVRRLSRRPAAK